MTQAKGFGTPGSLRRARMKRKASESSPSASSNTRSGMAAFSSPAAALTESNSSTRRKPRRINTSRNTRAVLSWLSMIAASTCEKS